MQQTDTYPHVEEPGAVITRIPAGWTYELARPCCPAFVTLFVRGGPEMFLERPGSVPVRFCPACGAHIHTLE